MGSPPVTRRGRLSPMRDPLGGLLRDDEHQDLDELVDAAVDAGLPPDERSAL